MSSSLPCQGPIFRIVGGVFYGETGCPGFMISVRPLAGYIVDTVPESNIHTYIHTDGVQGQISERVLPRRTVAVSGGFTRKQHTCDRCHAQHRNAEISD